MTHRIRVVALFALMTGCGGPWPTAPSALVGSVTMTGRVIDFASGAGVAAVGINFGEQRLIADANGRYSVTVPIGNYRMRVDGERIDAVVLVRGPWTRGDFFAHGEGCGMRYGNVTNRRTRRPIAGAKINPRTSGMFYIYTEGTDTVTDSDGWYRKDYGCGSCFPCNTTVMTVVAPHYREASRTLGRGVRDLQRLDIELEPDF